MSFDECIINGQREGSITETTRLHAIIEQGRAMIEELGEGGAAAAARETFDQLKYDGTRNNALLKIKKFKELTNGSKTQPASLLATPGGRLSAASNGGH